MIRTVFEQRVKKSNAWIISRNQRIANAENTGLIAFPLGHVMIPSSIIDSQITYG